MITIVDRLGLCDLDEEEEVEAVAQHKHIPVIVAIEMVEKLVHETDGLPKIRQMIVDGLVQAQNIGHEKEIKHWQCVLQRFDENHRLHQA